MAVVAIGGALWLRFDGNVPVQYMEQLSTVVPLFVLTRLGFLGLFRTYSSLWRYATMRQALAAGVAVAVGSGTLFLLSTMTGVVALPRSVFAIEALLFVFLAGAPRFYVRWRRAWMQRGKESANKETTGKRVLIVGAGDAGAMLVRELEQQAEQQMHVVGLVDDDVTKINREIGGVRVLGNRDEIPGIVAREGVERIIIAMPSVEPGIVRETMAICKQTGVELKMLPPLGELMSGRVRAQDVRNVEIEDLLRRDPVKTDLFAISDYLRGKRVLVTGAGGSIGSELCRQVCTFEPAELIMLDHSENSVFDIDGELRERYPEARLIPVIGDIRNRQKMDHVFARYKPDVVFHAAAHKHVPLMEANPDEAIANNVLGTRNVAEAAARSGAERFVMVSTDKAVNPGNVMGATKRMAELVVQAMQARQTATRFVSVRFGNVLGSRGSVIPRFRAQIEQGGPVTVTHPEMTRYFMTIPEAVQLIIQSAAIGHGGEVFVLDMGEPVRIADLAHDLIRLSGFEPGKDIAIVYTGVRPGEKLFEELINDGETVRETSHDKIMALNGDPAGADSVDRVDRAIRTFEELLEGLSEPATSLSSAVPAATIPAVATAPSASLVAALYEAVGGEPVDTESPSRSGSGNAMGSGQAVEAGSVLAESAAAGESKAV